MGMSIGGMNMIGRLAVGMGMGPGGMSMLMFMLVQVSMDNFTGFYNAGLCESNAIVVATAAAITHSLTF